MIDPDIGAVISDAEVVETEFTAFASTDRPVTARLIVRRAVPLPFLGWAPAFRQI